MTSLVLRERVQSDAEEIGLTFGPGRPIAVDPVPRLIEAVEWEALEAGLAQRARALNAFLADAYGEQRIFAEGIVPRRLLETSAGYEPLMRGLLDLELPPATVAGLDLVRDARRRAAGPRGQSADALGLGLRGCRTRGGRVGARCQPSGRDRR